VSPERVTVGATPVRRLGLGAMALTGPGTWGQPRDAAEARRVLHRAVELGVELVDTADSYGPEVSEQLVADALHPYPEGLLVATKGGFVRPAPGRWAPDARPDRLRLACEGSLLRLRVDRIDLYQLHVVDPAVPIEESLGALFELQREGKIRDIGVCNVEEDDLVRALDAGPIASVQNRYSLAERGSEGVLARCTELGLPFIAWAPLAKGFLTRGQGALATIAARHGATPGQVALAWLLRRSAAVLPIPGTSSVGHLEENAGSASLELEPADVARLDALHLPAYRARRAVRRSRIAIGRLKDAARGEGR
jgi:aryl-alcohol dehydrogenase-like predicted oxidoreductase